MKRKFLRRFCASVKSKVELNLLFGSHFIPHPEKEATGGEDSFFVDFNNRLFGIADGVGGYITKGINSGLYSRAILEKCQEQAASTDLLNAVVKATKSVNSDGVQGGCTVTLGKMSGNN